MADLMALFNEAFREFLEREHDNIRANISKCNLCGRIQPILRDASGDRDNNPTERRGPVASSRASDEL